MQPVKAKAILFDLDGTLVDSWNSIEYAWKTWCLEHSLEYNDLIHRFNGSRAVDIILTLKPHLNAEVEKAKIDAFEMAHPENISAICGALKILSLIPSHKWGIVTSGSQTVVNHKLKHAGIDHPKVLITADNISEGKPHPQGYLKAASLLKTDPKDCLVFEDSPQGIKAALAAGMKVIALSTTFPAESLKEAHAYIDNYEILNISIDSSIITISKTSKHQLSINST